MKDRNQAIQTAHVAFKRGDHAVARQHLESVDHPKAIHLLGLVEKAAGNFQLAVDLLNRAAAADPGDHEIAHNQGLIARQLGQIEDAETAFNRALKLNPGFSQAGISLGRLLIDLERWDEAKLVYDYWIEKLPDSVPVRYGFATVLLALGDAENAQSVFDALIVAGNDKPEIHFMRARARLELRRTEEAVEDLWSSYRSAPTPLCLKTLAGTLWMQKDLDAFYRLLDESVADPGLVVTATELLRQSGDHERALGIIESTQTRVQLPAEAFVVASTAYIDAGKPEQARHAAQQCLDELPEHRAAMANLITALLMQGHADEAMHHIGMMRTAEPHRQHWIAYEAIALRLQGSSDYHQLVDIERFVRSFTLPVPEGFDTLEAFNEQYLKALDQWHLYKTHPLDQSLREGSQTPTDLTQIDDPTIRAFITALDGPIHQYMEEVGAGDDHPLTMRNTGSYKITGCWSVRLKGGGWHVSHVHPAGWLSSAYYAQVPQETCAGADKAGWIQFGQPPFETIPPSPPEKWIQPKAGVLVIFPSFMWHGTNPIHDGSTRVTSPFDAVPV